MQRTFSLIVLFLVVTLLSFAAAWQVQTAWGAEGTATKKEVKMDSPKKVVKSEEQWKKELTPEQYRILRQAGTERAFTGALNDVYDPGLYRCGACGAPLFRSDTKYDHGTGWPSFTAPIAEGAIEYRDDNTYGMERIEVRCAACGSHLGHVFDDGPAPGGKHYCINSASMKFDKAAAVPAGPAKATFAAGCFWGVEFKLSQVPGVLSTRVGYTGGTTKDPSYEEVCTDETGHAEAVEVTYDPAKVSYEELLDTFFALHDPTQVDRQGPDVGAQYRSAVFYHSAAQELAASTAIKKLNASGKFRRPIATQVAPAGEFYPAEEYHQKYYQKRGKQGCGL